MIEARMVADVITLLAADLKPYLSSDNPTVPAHVHVGALLADVALQSGLNYRRVVAPRISRIVSLWPGATVRQIQAVERAVGARLILAWNHDAKPRRFSELLQVCTAAGLCTVADLREWSGTCSGQRDLRAVNGLGPKSVDYFRRLCGHEAVPMDRYLFRLLALAGVQPMKYELAQEVFVNACRLVGLNAATTERAVWQLFSRGRSRRARATHLTAATA